MIEKVARDKQAKAAYDAEYKTRPVVQERLKAYRRAYYLANKEKIAAKCAVRYELKKEAIIEQSREYYAANKDERSAKKSEWKRANKARVAFHRANRRASELRATPAWANKEKISEFYVTANGLSMITGEWHHVDHIVPLQGKVVCGLHIPSNLRVVTAKENLSKHNKL